MPNIPQHFDFPRFAHAKAGLDEWVDVFHKMLERQWGIAVQAYNAVLRTSVTADRPSTPFLDEALWFESDTGRLYIAVGGVWQILTGWTGNTTSTSVSYTMLSSDGVILANATSGAIVVTPNNGTTYTSRIRAVKKVDVSGNVVYIQPSSGLIEGASQYALSAQWDAATFTSDGTNLFVVGRRA